MPCNHKFSQYLRLNDLDFEPTTLIVGTFNPEWPLENYAPWFYGRTDRNNFWEVLPRLYNEDSLRMATPKDWKKFCKQKKIAITDMISCIDDADVNDFDDVELLAGYSDKAIAKSFKGHVLNDIVGILNKNTDIRNIYFTRSASDTFWKKLWQPIIAHCNLNNIRAKTLLTPSGYAYFQQGKYNKMCPEQALELPDFILMKWQREWHKI